MEKKRPRERQEDTVSELESNDRREERESEKARNREALNSKEQPRTPMAYTSVMARFAITRWCRSARADTSSKLESTAFPNEGMRAMHSSMSDRICFVSGVPCQEYFSQ